MQIFRLTKARYTETAFGAVGARLSDGRWHRAGAPVVYAADAPASALLEVVVHTEAAALLYHAYVLFRVELDPDRHLLRLPEAAWPPDWQAPLWPRSTQEIGRRWLDDRDSVVLEVPSAVVPFQRNYLINVAHPDFADLRVTGPDDFRIDPRLGRRG